MRRALVLAALVLFSARASAAPRNTSADAVRRLAELESEVQAHVHALRYSEARATAEAALALGAATASEVARLARSLGEIAAALDQSSEAGRWFLLWLSLDSNAALPAGISPKVAAPFQAARTLHRGALIAKLVVEPTPAGAIVYRITYWVENDPAAFGAQVALNLVEGNARRSTEEVALPPGTSADKPFHLERELPLRRVELSLRDRHGNELASALAASGDQQPRRRATPWLRRPSTYGVGVGVAVTLAGVFAWRSSVARDELDHILANSDQYTFADAEAARRRADRHAWGALASIAAVGVLVTTGFVMAREPAGRTVAVVPTQGGAIVLATSPF